MEKGQRLYTREQQDQQDESLSPLHVYFSRLMDSRQSLVGATLIQDNPAAYKRSSQAKRPNSAKARPAIFCQQTLSSSSFSSSDVFSALDDTLLLMETDRWESESTMDSSDHSSGCDVSASGRNKPLSEEKPKLPKRRASPIVIMDEPQRLLVAHFCET